ncbi:Hypothetical protein, putative [Bodo saltans]|uniref:Uncharacterized protein n=1 Tax=Bodo saltans TaxID=75058 RepID=A0A0S4IZV2_BODSA|nr:Hypothetical protein, putative [Bodo saltans]|eukprot:CUG06132.1 Hypothetical protein, putative [Bodo saltans]
MVDKRARKHISFGRGPRVTVVRAQPKSDHPKLWFQQSETVVTKPLVFEIPCDEKISINIGLNVRLTSIGCTDAADERVALRICPNPSGEFADSLDERLMHLRSKKSLKEPEWFVCGTTRGGEIAKINVILPAGEYLLQCSGKSAITVFGQAADVVRQLK